MPRTNANGATSIITPEFIFRMNKGKACSDLLSHFCKWWNIINGAGHLYFGVFDFWMPGSVSCFPVSIAVPSPLVAREVVLQAVAFRCRGCTITLPRGTVLTEAWSLCVMCQGWYITKSSLHLYASCWDNVIKSQSHSCFLELIQQITRSLITLD